MKNNQSYQYFTWGSHDHHHHPFYILGDWTTRRIYLTGEDHDRMKMIQFIMLPWKHLVFMDVGRTMNYRPGLIDNSVCLNWFFRNTTVSGKTGLGFTGAWLTARRSYLEDSRTEPPDSDVDDQKKFLIIQHVLSSLDEHREIQVSMIEQDLEHNREFARFCQQVLPHDHALIDIINQDQHIIESNHDDLIRSDRGRQQVIGIMSELDYLRSSQDILQEISNGIRNHQDMDPGFKSFVLEKI